MYIILQDDYNTSHHLSNPDKLFKVLDTSDLVVEIMSSKQLMIAVSKIGAENFTNLDWETSQSLGYIVPFSEVTRVGNFVWYFDEACKLLKQSPINLSGCPRAFAIYNRKNHKRIYIEDKKDGLYLDKVRILRYTFNYNGNYDYKRENFAVCLTSIYNLRNDVYKLTFQVSAYVDEESGLYDSENEDFNEYSWYIYLYVSLRDGKCIGVGTAEVNVDSLPAEERPEYVLDECLLRESNLAIMIDTVQESPEVRHLNVLRAKYKVSKLNNILDCRIIH